MSLPALDGQRHDGAEWPAHRFLFGTAAELASTLNALRQRPDVAEIGSGDAPEGLMPRTLLLTGGQDGFSGALLACSDPGRLAEVMAELGLSDAG